MFKKIYLLYILKILQIIFLLEYLIILILYESENYYIVLVSRQRFCETNIICYSDINAKKMKRKLEKEIALRGPRRLQLSVLDLKCGKEGKLKIKESLESRLNL